MKRTLIAGAVIALLACSSVVAAPAPPLSYVQIRYVGSSNKGGEWIPDNQLSTTLDHSGAQMLVLTVEVGYGSNPVAQINGATLPSSANYRTDPFCNYADFLEQCSAGQTIVGWVRYWNLNGYQGGSFWYQNRSINSPFNTLGDRLNIL
jgi:hypothetical protein